MKEVLVGSKTLPYESLYVVGRVWYRSGVPYAVPKFIAYVKDRTTNELRTNLTSEEIAKLEKETSERFGWKAKIIKLEDLEKEIDEKYREELLKAKAEGRIVFSFADALYNKIAELMNKKDPIELEI